MQPEQLIDQRKRDWERLENLLHRIERERINVLSQAELVEFGQLYRSATSDLAIAQRDFAQKEVTAFLNQLVGRAHPVVYRGEPLVWRRLFNFYRDGVPRLYRELLPFTGVAALLLFVPWLVSAFVVFWQPDAANYVLNPIAIDWIRTGHQWWKNLNEANEIGSADIMTHNLGVAFQAYAGGMLFGFWTVYILLISGVQFGTIFGLMHHFGHAAPMWEFVIGHGVLELSEITMAGGAGLMLGYALLRPGLLSRRDALGIAANKSIRLLLGTAPFLVIAGIIEGIISPSDVIPAFAKFVVGIGSGILMYAYLLLVGRKKSGDAGFKSQSRNQKS